jgi:hypothetical protein
VTVKLSKHHAKPQADDHVKSNSSIKSFSSSSSLTDETSGKKNYHVVLVTIWSGCRDHPRYSAIGHALVPLKVEDNNLPRIIGLFGHTKVNKAANHALPGLII